MADSGGDGEAVTAAATKAVAASIFGTRDESPLVTSVFVRKREGAMTDRNYASVK